MNEETGEPEADPFCDYVVMPFFKGCLKSFKLARDFRRSTR